MKWSNFNSRYRGSYARDNILDNAAPSKATVEKLSAKRLCIVRIDGEKKPQ